MMRLLTSACLGRLLLTCASTALFAAVAPGDVSAAGPRVGAEGELPDDCRLGDLTDLNGYFPFAPSDSRRAAAARCSRAVCSWPGWAASFFITT